MELAKLIGSGQDAALLNMAMHRLGGEICTPRVPACGRCPLKQVCIAANGR